MNHHDHSVHETIAAVMPGMGDGGMDHGDHGGMDMSKCSMNMLWCDLHPISRSI